MILHPITNRVSVTVGQVSTTKNSNNEMNNIGNVNADSNRRKSVDRPLFYAFYFLPSFKNRFQKHRLNPIGRTYRLGCWFVRYSDSPVCLKTDGMRRVHC